MCMYVCAIWTHVSDEPSTDEKLAKYVYDVLHTGRARHRRTQISMQNRYRQCMWPTHNRELPVRVPGSGRCRNRAMNGRGERMVLSSLVGWSKHYLETVKHGTGGNITQQ